MEKVLVLVAGRILVSSSIKTWHQAQAYCKELGGDLVKINSEEENEFVLKLVNKRAPSLRQVWLALEWNPQRKAFIWADNSIPTLSRNGFQVSRMEMLVNHAATFGPGTRTPE